MDPINKMCCCSGASDGLSCLTLDGPGNKSAQLTAKYFLYSTAIDLLFLENGQSWLIFMHVRQRRLPNFSDQIYFFRDFNRSAQREERTVAI
jgi:hypothetical protein